MNDFSDIVFGLFIAFMVVFVVGCFIIGFLCDEETDQTCVCNCCSSAAEVENNGT